MCGGLQVCNNALLNQAFVHSKVQIWTSTIIENVLKELAVNNARAKELAHTQAPMKRVILRVCSLLGSGDGH